MKKGNTPNRSLALVLRVNDWTASQRANFMDSFSRGMEKLAPTMWKDALNSIPREDAFKIEDNPGDSPLFSLSFSPGFEGGPLRVSIKATVPPPVYQKFQNQVQGELDKLELGLKDDWLIGHLIPALGWLVRRNKEARQPEKIIKEMVDDERSRLEAEIPDISANYWMSHAAPSFMKIIILSASRAIKDMDLPSPIPPLLLEGDGKVVEVGLERLTSQVQSTVATPKVKIRV